MKISIITVVFNGVETIEDCIKSIASQDYSDIEHIIIDGGSTDGTPDVIREYKNHISRVISEPDNGMYDAMNKGIKAATGDIIGILNSDDLYADNEAIETVANTLSATDRMSCYSDLVYVDKHNTNKIIRHWKANVYNKERFKRGWMPPHPTFFVKKEIYDKYGLLNTNFPLAADYELMLRLLYKHEISVTYIPKVLVKMRMGGTSKPGFYTLKAMKENYMAWKINGLTPNPITFVLKPASKIFQFIKSRSYQISKD